MWLRSHRRSDMRPDMFLNVESRERMNNLDKILTFVGDKGSEYPEYFKFLKFKSPNPDLQMTNANMRSANTMQWMRGVRLLEKQGYFVAWNEESVNFYEFISKPELGFKSTCTVLMTIPCAIFTDMTTKEDFVTDVLVFNSLHYIVVATNFGNIKVFKWDEVKRTKKVI
jgi:hypothetical protein